MLRIKFTFLIIILVCPLSYSQQRAATHRVGDAFRGAISRVRSEMAFIKHEGDKQIEKPRVLAQIITYSEDGLTKTSVSYAPDGSVSRRSVETYLPGGNQQSYSATGGDGSFLAKRVSEYDRGRLLSETRYKSPELIDETILTSSTESSQGIVAVTRTRSDGTPVDSSLNSRHTDGASRHSRWTTTKADGSRVEKTFSVDKSGNHRDEEQYYNSNGSLDRRRVSMVDAGVTRLEASVYAADGTLLKKSLNTREYDSHRNIIKHVNYRWDADSQEFVPVLVTYHTISYRDQ